MFIYTNKVILKGNLYFNFEGISYYLSQVSREYFKFEIKVRSSTNNINIIYSSEYNGVNDDFGRESLWKLLVIYEGMIWIDFIQF